MKLSIVIIGDEILLGRVTDTNSGLIARTFNPLGWDVVSVRTVGDKADDIRSAIESALYEGDMVITTGGLGPTRDDITKPVLTSIFGGEMAEDPSVSRNIESIFEQRGLELNELTRRQAWVPSSCTVIQNILGTAPLMWFEKDSKVLVAMPGVPFETRGMLPEVLGRVKSRFGDAAPAEHREFTVTGISESALAERLASFEDALPEGFKLAYLPVAGEIILRLDGVAGAPSGLFDEIAEALIHAVGGYLAGTGKVAPAELLLHKLRRRGWTLATAESCTGGNIAHCITAIAGSSDTFNGGIVSYANEVKINVLGVSSKVIESDGAVSEATVEAMASGACRVCNSDCAVATSGIAGPSGAVPGKPVGTVWIAARTPERQCQLLFHFGGDREAVIERASAAAMNLLADLL